MGRAYYNGSIEYPRVIIRFGGAEYSIERDDAENLRDSIHKAINDLDEDKFNEHRQFLRSIPKDPSTGMLKPATPEQWRRLLDDAGLDNIKEPG